MIENKVILFDGVCNLCNSSVNFIIDRDKNNIFKFAALQSEAGKNFLCQFSLNETEFDSVVLISGNKYFVKSDAALNIVKEFPGFWKTLYVFRIIPLSFRNYLYDFIAHNRYKIFGRKDSCRIPTPELKEKFL
ncbi:MAG: thiol-disulfide oxidoreductase DCC family protein [Ignavibacteria bacterium]|nr:thiol-disulfide oxidoreductase DCC family protein [Ignavibacteria bacterium]